MPRKSSASLSVVAQIDERRTRVKAPVHLAQPIASIFDAITASVSATHLRPCDMPLIEALAVAIHNGRQAAAAVDRDGLLVDGRINPHIGIAERSAKVIATLSTKLKLSPAGRLDRKDVGRTTRSEQCPTRGIDAIDELLDEEGEEEES